MFQMHVLHFQLGINHIREMLSLNIRTQDFFYRGPTCVIRPNELAMCLPCANNSFDHTGHDGDACELATMQGWMPPARSQSVATYILDNQSGKHLVLEQGQSLFKTLTVGLKHRALYTKCRVNPHYYFQYTHNAYDHELMDEDDDDDDPDAIDQTDDDDDDDDEGIYGDINTNIVYIALEHVELNYNPDLN